jgi:DNA/RNA-binding domain of Phe-tRNA-synthetase-like protein
MLAIAATPEWRAAHPGGIVGLLELSGADNSAPGDALDDRKRATEASLRERYRDYSRAQLVALPVMAAYVRHYKRFDKTYHVLLQMESIVSKGKSLPRVSPLVDANFTAEVETLVLTAGHDAAKLPGPVSIDVARDGDQLTQMSGAAKAVPAGDMIMRDGQGVACSIVYGQDNRSPISRETSRVLYVAYGPTGVPAERVDAHLRLVEDYVRLVAPAAVTEQRRLIVA